MRPKAQLPPPIAPLAILLLALLAALLPAGLAAQAWRGTAAFRLEVEDRGGRPAAGVEAHLQYMELEPAEGPPAVLSDSTGTITFAGLAEGRWLLELYFEGTKPYAGILQVEAGKRPVMVAGPIRDAAAAPLDVKLVKFSFRGEAPARDRERGNRRSQRQAPATPPPPPRLPAPAPEPAAAPAVEPVPAPAEPVPAPAEALPMPEPAAEPASEPPPAPTEAPPPEVPAPAPEPAAAPAEIPAPSAPAPSPPVMPAPVPDPEPTAVAVRSARSGDCPECKDGEMAVTAIQSAGPFSAGGECGAAAAMEAAIGQLLTAAAATLKGYTGPLVDPGTGNLTAAAGIDARGAVQPLLAPYLDPAGPCQVLAVVLPARARYRGYAYAATDASGGGACVGGEECDIGLARWVSHPVIRKGDGFTVLYGLFTNLSPNRERRAALTVYFSER